MSHPTIAERARAKQAEWENTKDEAAELVSAAIPGSWLFPDFAVRDVIAAALWLVDHLYSTGECGTTMAREGDLEDVKTAVEALRKVAA